MSISEWPEKFKDKVDDSKEIVSVSFAPTGMLVAAVTAKAIGLAEDEASGIEYWIPLSRLRSHTPRRGEWVEFIEIPRWLAEEKKLEYEDI